MIRWLFVRRLQTILQMVKRGPHRRVLDFGCGAGLLTMNLSTICERVYAYDVELTVVSQAVQEFGASNVRVLRGAHWWKRLAPASLDAIVAADVLEHIQALEATATLLGGILAPHGRLVISGPTEHFVYRVGRWLAGFRNEYHQRNVSEIRQVLESQGFRLQEQKRLPFPVLIDAFHIFSMVRYGADWSKRGNSGSSDRDKGVGG